MSAPLLTLDNHDLYDRVRLMILSTDPVFTIDQIAFEFAVDPNDLMKWIMAYKAPGKRRAVYQTPAASPIGLPRRNTGPSWARDVYEQKMAAWAKARDGARATRLGNA